MGEKMVISATEVRKKMTKGKEVSAKQRNLLKKSN